MDPPSYETLPSPADTATQSASHDEALSTEAQSTESLSVTEETAPILPVASESRNSPPAPREPPVVDQGEPSSQHVSFSMIMKLPSLTEKKKSKRSKESEIVTSSPYKQSLVEKKTEQNKKSKQKLFGTEEKSKKAKVQQPKCKKAKMENKKSKKTKNVSTDIVEDSQCPMCDGFWSDSLAGEDWVQCSECKNWLHEECCCSVTPTSVTCDLCL